ncbi:TonB family protein [bacterium]|nr:TonB family protein [bacterium]
MNGSKTKIIQYIALFLVVILFLLWNLIKGTDPGSANQPVYHESEIMDVNQDSSENTGSGHVTESQSRDDEIIIDNFEEMPSPHGGYPAIITKFVIPDSLKNTGLSGRIIVAAKIGEDGQVLETRVLQSVHTVLDQSVINAVRSVSWNPCKACDKPQTMWVSIPVKIDLR